MLPYSMIAGGTFTVSVTNGVAAGVNVQCIPQNPPDLVIARAITNWGVANKARSIEWWWERSMGNGTAKGILQSQENSNPQLPAMTAYTLPRIVSDPLLDAITCYDTTNPPTFAGLAATAITGIAGTFVVTMTNTGTIAVGDYVRLVNVTGEEQISGYTFQVTAVTANTSITLGYMASSGITFAADATAATVIKFIPNRMYPRRRYIANITQAAQAKVYFTEKNDFTPGEKVGFRVTSEFGMKQINYLEGRVLTVTNTATESSIVTDINSSGFTAFVFPTSADVVAGNSNIPAICVPSTSAVVPLNGSATVAQQPPGTNLLDAFDNRNTRIIRFGAALFNVSGHVADDGETWQWRAFKYDDYQTGSV